MLPLRFPKLWTAVAWLLTAAVIVGSLVPGPVVAAIPIRDKVMHAGSYFILMVCFAGIYRRGLYPVVAGVLIMLGVSLDLLQLLTDTRSFDLGDVAMNCAGVATGLVLSWWLLGGWCQRVEQRLLS
ncbi:MAG TPA: VanZ family protein [Gammaproteobacteria bacterium]|nr:VanZ family protein [Gammaproteobacteria bacterium]